MKHPFIFMMVGAILALSNGAHAQTFFASSNNKPKILGDKTGNGAAGDKTGNGIEDENPTQGRGDKTGNGFGGDKTGNGAAGDKTGNGLNNDVKSIFMLPTLEYQFNFGGDKTGNGGYAMEDLVTHELEPHDETYARDFLGLKIRNWDPSLTRAQILDTVLNEVRAHDPKLYEELMISKAEYDRLSVSLASLEDEIGPDAYDMLVIPQSYDMGIELSDATHRPKQVINWFNPGDITLTNHRRQKSTNFDMVLRDDASIYTMKTYRQAWMDFHEISFETHRRFRRQAGFDHTDSSLGVQYWTAQFFTDGAIDWSIRAHLFASKRQIRQMKKGKR